MVETETSLTNVKMFGNAEHLNKLPCHLSSTLLLFSRSNPPGFLLQSDCVRAAWWRSAADDWDELAPGCCWETDDASREGKETLVPSCGATTARPIEQIFIYICTYTTAHTLYCLRISFLIVSEIFVPVQLLKLKLNTMEGLQCPVTLHRLFLAQGYI